MKTIKIYTKNNCPACRMTMMTLKNLLSKKELHFEDVAEEINLDSNPEALTYVKEELNIRAAPVVEADGFGIFAQFQPNKLKEIVNSI